MITFTHTLWQVTFTSTSRYSQVIKSACTTISKRDGESMDEALQWWDIPSDEIKSVRMLLRKAAAGRRVG